MNKLILSVVFSLSICITLVAQNSGKVRGDKNVTSRQTEVSPFHTIIVDEDFEIDIIYNSLTSVILETDENLHEYINFAVIDGVLSFDKTAKITSNKKLNITVNYDNNLTNIRTKDKGEITSVATLNLDNVILITEGSSKVGLTLKTNNLEFQGNDKSKIKLNLTCNKVNINLTDNCKLEALIYSPTTKIDLYQRANASVEGETNDLVLRTDNYTLFDGKNFTAKTCSTTNEISSDAYLEVLESITVDASGSSNIYLYNEPKIIINKLAETSKLQKKLK